MGNPLWRIRLYHMTHAMMRGWHLPSVQGLIPWDTNGASCAHESTYGGWYIRTPTTEGPATEAQVTALDSLVGWMSRTGVTPSDLDGLPLHAPKHLLDKVRG